jgi:hypothetical protein
MFVDRPTNNKCWLTAKCSMIYRYNLFIQIYVTGNMEYWAIHILLEQFEHQIEILIILIITIGQYFTNNLSYFYYNSEQSIKYQYNITYSLYNFLFHTSIYCFPRQFDKSFIAMLIQSDNNIWTMIDIYD